MNRSLLLCSLLTVSCSGNGQATCQEARMPSEAIEISVPPFQQVRRGNVRVRIESPAFTTIPFSMETQEQQCATLVPAEPDRLERSWALESTEHPDVAGEFTLYTATLDQMLEGVEYSWSAHTKPLESDAWTGSVRVPKGPGDGATVGFVGSIRPPVQRDLFLQMREDTPDMVILGGDLQSHDTAESTWSQLMHDLAPLTTSALLHTVHGDKDEEDGGELDEIYLRWFGGQGRAGGGELYYSVDIGGVRFVVMDTSDPLLTNAGNKQLKWVKTELADVTPLSPLTGAVIVMHNGTYSLADQRPFYELRDSLAEVIADAEVKLVLSANGQAYERFDIEGVQYVVGGTGGAELSTFDTRSASHPDDVPLQTAGVSDHGYTLITIDEEGSMLVEHKGMDGTVLDEVSIPIETE